MKRGANLIRLIIATLLLLLSSGITAVNVYGAEPYHLQVARQFVGVTEHGGNNRGPEVEMFLRSVGLGPGYAWCAAFVSYCLTAADVQYPIKRTAGARNFISRRSVRAIDVLRGSVKVQPGWLAIWQHGNSWAGHVAFVISWLTKSGRTIEGNTSSGKAGSQSDGDGVFERHRSIVPGNRFRITHFEPVEGKPRPKLRKVTIEDLQGSSAGPMVPPVNGGGWAR